MKRGTGEASAAIDGGLNIRGRESVTGGRTGVRMILDSRSEAVYSILQDLESIITSLESMDRSAGNAYRPSRALDNVFKSASAYWAARAEEHIHRIARSNKGFPHEHWTRHMYSGGNPSNVGIVGHANFELVGDHTSSKLGIDMNTRHDKARSWSPIRESIYRASGKKKKRAGLGSKTYDPWTERTEFMAGVYAAEGRGKDFKRLYGKRNKGDGARNGKPLYIVGVGSGSETGYNLSDRFSTDYSGAKQQRDRDLKLIVKGLSATKVMANLDTSTRSALNRAFKKAFADARVLERQARAARNLTGMTKLNTNTKTLSVSGKKGGSYAPRGMTGMQRDVLHDYIAQEVAKW